MVLHVVKRSGAKESLDFEKINRVVIWATEGLAGVSASEVALKSKIQFYNNIKTSDIHETLIKAAADLISEEAPNYQYVAGRLVNYQLRKQVYGQYEPIHLYDLIVRNVETGFYDSDLLAAYTREEWDRINGFVDHERDMSLAYAGMEQLRGKYLVQNRVTGQIMETPQVAYALIAATLFSRYPKATRMTFVRDYYEAISKHDISLPTPLMAGVRTPERQFSSCVLIETDDSLKSMSATAEAIMTYVSQKAGIGIGAGRIRPLGSPVKKGAVSHTGVIPFFKHFQSAVRSCSQGGVRNGAATLYYPIWHLEVENLLVLKNNKGTEDTRIRHMDYGVQFNKLFYERLITGGDITLFSPADHPEMYEAFFNDQDKFRALYEAAERDPKVKRKKTMKALDLFSAYVQERKDTGRIYLQNVDNANTHSSFREEIAPVRQSNLCSEIDLPTRPMASTVTRMVTLPKGEMIDFLTKNQDVIVSFMVESDTGDRVTVTYEEDDARIALCTLSAINWGNIREPKDFEKPCMLAVRALDELLDYQSYPVKAAELATREHRPLGIGIINLAYWLAKHGLRYTDGSALEKIDEFAEAWSYYLIKASIDLAKEKGPCERWTDTKYSLGVMPVDTRKRDVDELVPHTERMDWDALREEARVHGIRNATLMALMPAETSAQVANATNGIEPPRAYVSVKQSKHGVMKQVVPEFRKLKRQYELLWDQQSPIGYLNICAVLQKYIDQGISVNTSYNPKFYEDEQVPMSELLKHILHFYKFGGKQLYYNNVNDGQGEIDVNTLVNHSLEDTPPLDDEGSCDSCTI